MDFTLDCSLPMRPIGTYHDVPVGTTERTVSYHYSDVELSTLLPGDTLCGVDLSSTPIKVQKDLHRAGYTSTLEDSGVSLDDHPVSMYIFEDEIATICWHQTTPAPQED
ncbi:hypothetical protein [Corynebacterium kalidii]